MLQLGLFGFALVGAKPVVGFLVPVVAGECGMFAFGFGGLIVFSYDLGFWLSVLLVESVEIAQV